MVERVAKMNIFIGKNSSGKSSILSALLGIQALTRNSERLPLPFKNLSWLHRKGTEEPMSMKLTKEDDVELTHMDFRGRIISESSVIFTELGTFLSTLTLETPEKQRELNEAEREEIDRYLDWRYRTLPVPNPEDVYPDIVTSETQDGEPESDKIDTNCIESNQNRCQDDPIAPMSELKLSYPS